MSDFKTKWNKSNRTLKTLKNGFISRTSIRYKLLAGMIFASTVPVLIVTLLTSNNIYKDVHEQVLQSNISSLAWANKNMEDNIERFSDTLYALDVNPQLKEDLRTWDMGSNALQYAAQSSLQGQLISALNSDKRIKAIELYTMSSGRALIVNYSQTVIYSNTELEDYLWQREDTLKNNYFKTDGNDLCMIRKINRFEDRKPIAGLLIRVDQRVVQDLFNIMISRNDEQIFLLNDQNEIVSKYPEDTTDLKNMGELLVTLDNRTDLGEYLLLDNNYVFSGITKDGRLRIIKIVPTKAVTTAPFENMRMGILIGLVSSFLAIVLAILLSRLISKPVVKLANTMRTLKLDDFKKTTFSNSYDEIGLLEDGFDSMIKRIDELINIEYRGKIETRTAQLNALQAQINPHFLHNTLQLIGGMSLARDSMDVYRITLALSTLMRYSMNFENEMVTIKEELNYLDNYLMIQNLRFGGRFTFENLIPVEFHEYLMPKLSLQPILENCFEHGFEQSSTGKQENWHIRISGVIENDHIQITVSDNGEGITTERLDEIRLELQEPSDKIWHSSEHIGLKNVDTRLKLRYGNRYGISINSIYEEGTQITLLFKTNSEEKKYEI